MGNQDYMYRVEAPKSLLYGAKVIFRVNGNVKVETYGLMAYTFDEAVKQLVRYVKDDCKRRGWSRPVVDSIYLMNDSRNEVLE